MLTESIIDGYLYSTDKAKLDVAFIHSFLRTSYWAKDIPITLVEESIENSVCVGIYEGPRQMGFARVVTDSATFAYLADVFVDERFRGMGVSKHLMEFIFSLKFAQKVRRFLLATRDAHGLYTQFGFKPLGRPEFYLEILHLDAYQKPPES